MIPGTRVIGSIITQSYIENALSTNPNMSVSGLADLFGVGIDTMYDALRSIGMERRKIVSRLVTDHEILSFIEAYGNATNAEIARVLETSAFRIKIIRSTNAVIPQTPKTNKLPISVEELKNEIERLIKNHKPTRQAVAESLNVSPPTILRYVKELIQEERLPANFQFAPGRKNKRKSKL